MATFTFTVKGKISNVRFLEAAPFNARKVRGDKGYMNYVFAATMNDAEYRALAERIEGHDDYNRTGCWFDAYEHGLDAEIAAIDAAVEAERAAQPLNPVWENIAKHLASKGRYATNDTCAEFALAQVEKLEGRHRYGETARRLQQLAWDLDSNDMERAAQAWADNREWLKTL